MRKQGIKPIKSINTEKDEYIKDEKSKYYHSECYVNHLINRKRMNEDDAREKLNIQMKLMEEEVKKQKERDGFYQWIMDYYESPLPAYFCIQVSKIVNGTHDRINEPIDYPVLLDIYKKMAVFLNKNATKKGITKIGQRMNYDLATVLGNYGDYKKYIEKQQQDEIEKKEVENKIIESKRFNKHMEQKNEQRQDEFDLLDVMDDLLL